MRYDTDLYVTALDACVALDLSESAVRAAAEAMWSAKGNSVPALLAWATAYNVPLTCPACGGSGCVTEQLDISESVTLPVDAPCDVCQPPNHSDDSAEALP